MDVFGGNSLLVVFTVKVIGVEMFSSSKDNVHTYEELRMMQALPLDLKVALTKDRIRGWVKEYGEDKCYVSFSGGKDSTVLLHLVREMYPDIPAVFSNTGLEYPEIQTFAKSFENVQVVTPRMNFKEVITTYGYPFISKEVSEAVMYARKFLDSVRSGTGGATRKVSGAIDSFEELANTLALTNQGGQRREIDIAKLKELEYIPKGSVGKLMGWLDRDTQVQIGGIFDKKNRSSFNLVKWQPLLYVDFRISHKCCGVMKKKPVHDYQKKSGRDKPFVGTMAEESTLRTQAWLRHGCNAFESSKPQSTPMAFWTGQDVLRYIKDNNITIAPVYGDIVQVDEDGNEYDFTLSDTCKYKTTECQRTGCIFCGYGAHLEKGEGRFERLKRTHPKQYDYCMRGGQYDEQGMWIPSKDGLGMAHCIDELNKIYGKDFIKY